MKYYNYRKFLFIHIPKTGGTSISSLLIQNSMDNWIRKYPSRHDPYFFMQQSNKITNEVFSFSVVRNPYTRSYSYFKHFNYQNNLNVSFKDFLLFIKNKKYFSATPMIQFPQSFYILDNNNNLSLSKIYRFENLFEFEEDFKIKLPHLRKGFYSKEDYYKDYTEETINLVKEIYNQDFKILNYSYSFS